MLARRLREEVPDEAVVQQLVDITRGVKRSTLFSVKPLDDGTFERVPIEVKETTTPADQLRGLVVLDLLTGGEIGISRIATVHDELPTRRYDRWLVGIDPRVVSSAEAFEQATNPVPILIEVSPDESAEDPEVSEDSEDPEDG